MEKNKIKVIDLLKKYNLYTKKILDINFHLNILNTEANLLVLRIKGIKDLEEKDLAVIILDMILKCDQTNPEYDQKLDLEMTRFGLKTDKFYGRHHHGPWVNETFEDDYFGFGTSPVKDYDDLVDLENEKQLTK